MAGHDATFTDGWMRFWGTFARPWPVVVGFAVATVVSDVVFETLKAIALAVWK